MEGDRWGTLAKWLALRDPRFYENFDRRDPLHLLREKVTFDQLERELRLRLVELRQRHSAAASGFPDVEAASEQFEHAQEDWYEVGRRMLPYLEWPAPAMVTLDEANIPQLKAMWEQAFNAKVDGPEVQAYAEARMTPPATPPPSASWVTPPKAGR